MSSERLERIHEVINEDSPLILSNYPINWAGVAVHLRNDNPNDVVLTVQESDNGSTWTVKTFSTPALGGQLEITLAELSFASILFASSSKYVRFTTVAESGGTTLVGVYADLTQWPPKGLVPSEYA